MRTETAVQLSVVAFNFLVAKLGLLYIFPILPDITHTFFPELTESELGFRQGYLAGIYFLGIFCGSLFWGKISDRIGRKRAMMLTTFLYSIAIQGRIQDFSQGGPGVSEATDRKGGFGGLPPRKILNLRGSNIDL